METIASEFSTWTEYDDWLIQNYNDYAVVNLNEADGKIKAEYVKKEDWNQMQKQNDN